MDFAIPPAIRTHNYSYHFIFSTLQADNLKALSITLSSDEVKQLSTRPMDLCSFDSWYECVETPGHYAPKHPFTK